MGLRNNGIQEYIEREKVFNGTQKCIEREKVFKKIKEKIGKLNGVEGEGRRCIFFVKNKVFYKCKSFFPAARFKKDAT